MKKFTSMSMRKEGQKHPVPLFIAQNDPTARALRKVRGPKTPIASRACVPRRALHRRKQGVIFQTKTYGPGSMPKQKRARMEKLGAFGLSQKVLVRSRDPMDARHFDVLAGEKKKNTQFIEEKSREVISFLRALAAARTPEARRRILRY